MSLKNKNIYIILGLMIALVIDAKGQESSVEIAQQFKPKLILKDTFSTILYHPFSSSIYKTYQVEKLPLFCKTEHKWSKLSGINVRMRLGSLEYVDKLEGK